MEESVRKERGREGRPVSSDEAHGSHLCIARQDSREGVERDHHLFEFDPQRYPHSLRSSTHEMRREEEELTEQGQHGTLLNGRRKNFF
jgi:hypothetical protein